MKRIDMMTSTQKCFLKETIGEATLKHDKTNFVCECDIGRISCLECYFRYDDCDKTIQCAELRNGTVAYGDLIITTISKATED